jgi:Xaa-Pro aminopeptidase
MLIKEKVAQGIELLREFGIDCWITFVRETAICRDPTLAYLVDADLTWHSAIILTRSGMSYAVVGEYDRRTVDDLGVYDEVIGYVKGVKEPLQQLLRRINPTSIAVNYSKDSEVCDGITHGMFLTLVELLREKGMEGRIVQADKIISGLRQRKTPTELSRIKEAIRNTEELFASVAEFLRPGRSEKEIAGFLKEGAKRRQLELAWEEKVCPAVFAGPDTAAAHYAPSDRRLAKGQLVNMDFGLKVDGYCSDLQRTFYVLEEGEEGAPPDVRRGFETIVRSIELARRTMRVGVEGIAVDQVARSTVVSAGYEEFPHALGHQVGRFAHDGTALLGPAWEKYGRKPFEPLEVGMVFTIEPRLTVRDRGIATVEEMVVITGEGAEWLSTPQKQIFLVRSPVD